MLQWKPADSCDRFTLDMHNFGDHLPVLFEPLFEAVEWRRMETDPVDGYTLLGSMLCDYVFQKHLDAGYAPHYFACGYRGKKLSFEVLAQVRLFGCRGRLSRRALAEQGSDVEMVGDSAQLLPLLIDKPGPRGEMLLMPHILDPKLDAYCAADFGCDAIISPVTRSTEELAATVARIAGSDFVLAGAMHAAIAAHAYGVPFAFFDAGHRDCPQKWEDWGTSVGLDAPQIAFFRHAREGREWHRAATEHLKKVRLSPLLRQADRMAKIRPEWWLKVRRYDAALAAKSA